MSNEESILIPQTKLRVFAVVLFSIFGMIVSTLIMSISANYLTRLEFTILGSLLAILYSSSVLSGLIQTRSMTSTLNKKSSTDNWVMESFQHSPWYRSVFYFALIFSAAITVIAAFMTPFGEEFMFELLLFWMVSFLSIASAPFLGRYQANGRVTEYFAIGAFSTLLRLCLVWISFALGFGISAYLLIFGLATLFTAYVCGRKSRDMDWELGSIQKSHLLPLGITVLLAISFQLDLILSSKVLSPFDAGTYVVASQMSKMVTLIALSASLTLLPAVMKRQLESTESISYYRKSISISLVMSSGLAMLGYILSNPIINLVFGSQFTESSATFVYLVPGTITWSIFLTQINLEVFVLKLSTLPFLLLLGCLQLFLFSVSSSPERYAISWSLSGAFAVLFFSLLRRRIGNRLSISKDL